MFVKTQLKNIASYSKGVQINGDKLIDDGIYDYLNGGIVPSGKWNDFNTPGKTITISEGGNSCGYVNYMQKPFWCGAHCYYLFDTKINSEYLYYALKSQQDRLMGIRSGACMPNIKKTDLGMFEIKYDTDENKQEIVVKALRNVEFIINSRLKELHQLDQLIKARFVEMFGDPVINNMNWRLQPLRESLKNIRYGTSSTPNFSDSGYSFIRATNIKSGHILLKDMKYISDKEAEKIKKCKLEVGEIIVVRSGVNSGDTCVIDKRFENQYAGYDIILTLCETLNSIFLNELFNTTYMDKVIKPLTRRAAQPHLNSEQIQGLPIIQVPMEMQNQFADFVQQIDKSKVVVQQALDEAQTLFDSLMQEYFG